jgi:hypothetical protein
MERSASGFIFILAFSGGTEYDHENDVRIAGIVTYLNPGYANTIQEC